MPRTRRLAELTLNDFAAYERVRLSGKYNMMTQTNAAAAEAGLDIDTYWGVLNNYAALAAMADESNAEEHDDAA